MRPRRRRRALADGHRDQRQDDDGADARGHAARRRAAGRGGRQRRAAAARGGAAPRARTTSWRSSSRASSCTGRSRSAPQASACLNVAPDHVDWHGSLEAYTRDKGRVYERTQVACVYNVADPATEQLVRDAEVVEGCRAVGFTLGHAGGGHARRRRRRAVRPGVHRGAPDVGGRAGHPGRPGRPRRRRPSPRRPTPSPTRWRRRRWPGPTGSRRGRCGTACAASRRAPIGSPASARSAACAYVDDSKATNPHAAAASLAAFDSVVWVAGGLLKGAGVDDLVRAHAGRLRAVVLLGQDRARDRRGAGATRAGCPRGRRGEHGH